ncbi:MAG: hypothetical protein HYZ69_00595 [Candidatus Colwellbacteria bacterium]|nr:hypothetical protein [Candidatus Colwellbacteria bacterium]
MTSITSSKNRDLSGLLAPHLNQWVALSPDYQHIIASGNTLKDTVEKVGKEQKEKAIFHKVIPPNYAPAYV